ncbi:hypothetical protein SVIRM249S_06888 [Streptomyces viridochromogenes]
MKGLVIFWMRRVASATAAVSGISTPAMISLMIFAPSENGVLRMDRASVLHLADHPGSGAPSVRP